MHTRDAHAYLVRRVGGLLCTARQGIVVNNNRFIRCAPVPHHHGYSSKHHRSHNDFNGSMIDEDNGDGETATLIEVPHRPKEEHGNIRKWRPDRPASAYVATKIPKVAQP